MNSNNLIPNSQWLAASKALMSPEATKENISCTNAFIRFDDILDLQGNEPPEELLMELVEALQNHEILIVDRTRGHIVTGSIDSTNTTPKQR